MSNNGHGYGDGGLDWKRRPVSYLLVALVRLYQVTLSRWTGGHCRFVPTCSEYFIHCVIHDGATKGVLKGLWRILRCNPFSKGGYDPHPREN
jgi:putative membrane protein insertion efficiency factor